jgi:methylglutaconyl-CoA hydratase
MSVSEFSSVPSTSMHDIKEPPLITDFRNGVLWLSINRPHVRNALNADLIEALIDTFESLQKKPEIRAVVLTGTGDKAFCSGADLRPNAAIFVGDHAQPMTRYADLLRIARATLVPVIGRINGYCLAGGMGLLAICDIAVAAKTAKFGLPEVKIGMFPMQVVALLRSLIPDRKFRELCFTGDMVDASEMLTLGLLNAAVDPEELDTCVDELLNRLMKASPTAIRRGKYALNAIADMTEAQALTYMEGQVDILPLTEDAREGLTAFTERRQPVWTGR